jgi:hypothetical protein
LFSFDFLAKFRGVPRFAARNEMGKDGRDAVRITATLPKGLAMKLEDLAKQNSVSMSWVVRRALERAVEDAQGGPLLPFEKGVKSGE